MGAIALKPIAWVGIVALLTGCGGDRRPAGSLRVHPSRLELAPGACGTVVLEWGPERALDRLHGSPHVFVHLLDRPVRPFEVVRTFDHPLPRPWRPGEPQRDDVLVCQSALAPPLPPGGYFLTAGLFDDSWGYRWPLRVEGRRIARREYAIADVRATGTRRPAPTFVLSGAWGPASRGTDDQVLARRPLLGEASIALRGIGEPGRVRLSFAVPPSASVRVESDCSPGFSATLGADSGPTAVPSSGRPGECDIRVFPSASPETGRVSLELLGWEPTPAE